ncbi:hypothetical protein RV11_GL002519 [Enterococcus phoeniculicola]|nr:hypothetical protein RV11_GL002519 [Enterococcus phoeniculicola]
MDYNYFELWPCSFFILIKKLFILTYNFYQMLAAKFGWNKARFD